MMKSDLTSLRETDVYTYNYLNQLTEYDPQVDDIEWVYEYDYYNRFVNVDKGIGGAQPSQLAAYTYNYLNRRVEEVAGSTIRYLYDVSTCVGDWTVSGATETLRNYYIDKILINVASGGTPNTDYFTTYGRFNSISEIVNTSSAVQNQYYYKAFGEKYNTTINVTQPFSWQSTPYDSNTGLYNHDNLDIDLLIANCLERTPLLDPQINPKYYQYRIQNLVSINPYNDYPLNWLWELPDDQNSKPSTLDPWCEPLGIAFDDSFEFPQKMAGIFNQVELGFFFRKFLQGNDLSCCKKQIFYKKIVRKEFVDYNDILSTDRYRSRTKMQNSVNNYLTYNYALGLYMVEVFRINYLSNLIKYNKSYPMIQLDFEEINKELEMVSYRFEYEIAESVDDHLFYENFIIHTGIVNIQTGIGKKYRLKKYDTHIGLKIVITGSSLGIAEFDTLWVMYLHSPIGDGLFVGSPVFLFFNFDSSLGQMF